MSSRKPPKYEYKVVWQREGRPKTRALYQTLEGAKRCAERQRTAREEMDWLEDPRRPNEIVFGPVIEHREVGPWSGCAQVGATSARIGASRFNEERADGTYRRDWPR